VLLLDEIEKAHPDLFNIPIAGDGLRQADRSHGKIVDFRTSS